MKLQDPGVYKFGAKRLKPGECARLVGRHQPRVSGHIRSQYRCQPALFLLQGQSSQ